MAFSYSMTRDKKIVAELLRRYRERQGWTRTELSKRTNLSLTSVIFFEDPNSDRSPKQETCLRIANALELTERHSGPYSPNPQSLAPRISALWATLTIGRQTNTMWTWSKTFCGSNWKKSNYDVPEMYQNLEREKGLEPSTYSLGSLKIIMVFRRFSFRSCEASIYNVCLFWPVSF